MNSQKDENKFVKTRKAESNQSQKRCVKQTKVSLRQDEYDFFQSIALAQNLSLSNVLRRELNLKLLQAGRKQKNKPPTNEIKLKIAVGSENAPQIEKLLASSSENVLAISNDFDNSNWQKIERNEHENPLAKVFNNADFNRQVNEQNECENTSPCTKDKAANVTLINIQQLNSNSFDFDEEEFNESFEKIFLPRNSFN